jgi:nickel transport protein
MSSLRTVLIAGSLCFAASMAAAHSLNLFVRDEGATVKGNAYFSGGTPAQNLTVRAEDAQGNALGETTTDAEGNFIYAGARAAGTMTFVVSSPDGHRAESKIESAAGATPAAPAAMPAASDAGMISYEAQLTRLHEAIDRLEKRLWMRDVIGGIGYIFGLAGLWALWKVRSRRDGH